MIIHRAGHYYIKVFTVSPFSEHTYLIIDERTRKGIIIDPGFYESHEEQECRNFLNDSNITVDYQIITHGHIDHLLGAGFVAQLTGCKTLAPYQDKYLFDSYAEQNRRFHLRERLLPDKIQYCEPTDIENIFTPLFTVIHTPGHTRGEICLYIEKLGILFGGDVLFKESVGRTDLPGGDLQMLLTSIREKLLTLPIETKVFPGHAESTTIGYEIEHNPFFL
jgi:glyoxylase-like metal-dependent hydrolase (beta-lactamase superfamily II)